jgi:MerR family transcriptional regulator/heat shock protein HspR
MGAFPPHVRLRPDDLSLAPVPTEKPAPGPEKDNAGYGGPELQGVYIISVAARLLEMHPQTLRKYERLGLVRPSRTIGMLRLYSQEDIEKLRLIKYLEENLGLNLAGVEFTLNLLNHLLEMQRRLSQIEEGAQFLGLVEREMAHLLERLNLPSRD